MQIELRLIVTLPDSLSVSRESVIAAFSEIIDNGCQDADDNLTHNDSEQGKIFQGLSTGYHSKEPLTIHYSIE